MSTFMAGFLVEAGRWRRRTAPTPAAARGSPDATVRAVTAGPACDYTSVLMHGRAPMIDRTQHSVLVVDDNAASRYALVRNLRAGGFNIVEAAAGAEALELCEFVSAVVLDV